MYRCWGGIRHGSYVPERYMREPVHHDMWLWRSKLPKGRDEREPWSAERNVETRGLSWYGPSKHNGHLGCGVVQQTSLLIWNCVSMEAEAVWVWQSILARGRLPRDTDRIPYRLVFEVMAEEWFWHEIEIAEFLPTPLIKS